LTSTAYAPYPCHDREQPRPPKSHVPWCSSPEELLVLLEGGIPVRTHVVGDGDEVVAHFAMITADHVRTDLGADRDVRADEDLATHG
jgi:hypothetical protein